jgi:hypothetical protein
VQRRSTNLIAVRHIRIRVGTITSRRHEYPNTAETRVQKLAGACDLLLRERALMPTCASGDREPADENRIYALGKAGGVRVRSVVHDVYSGYKFMQNRSGVFAHGELHARAAGKESVTRPFETTCECLSPLHAKA